VIAGLTEDCGPDCAAFVEKWRAWWREKKRWPFAIVDCSPGYLERLDRKSRAMVRKANRLYTYRSMDFNAHLAEVDAINASKPSRQGRPMQGWYTQPAQPTRPARLCAVHGDAWHGAFRRDDDALVAFARLARVSDELGILVSIMSHRDAAAAMNGMIAYLVESAGVRYIDYLHMRSATPSLEAFKRSVGFREVSYA